MKYTPPAKSLPLYPTAVVAQGLPRLNIQPEAGMRVLLVDPLSLYAPLQDVVYPTHSMTTLGKWLKVRHGCRVEIVSLAGYKTEQGASRALHHKVCTGNYDLVAFGIVDHTAAATLRVATSLPHTNVVIGGNTVRYERKTVEALLREHHRDDIRLASRFCEAFVGADDAEILSQYGDYDLYDTTFLARRLNRKTAYFSNACKAICTFCRRRDFDDRIEYDIPLETVVDYCKQRKWVDLAGALLTEYYPWEELLRRTPTTKFYDVPLRIEDLPTLRPYYDQVKGWYVGFERADELGQKLFMKHNLPQRVSDMFDVLRDRAYDSAKVYFVTAIPGETHATVDENMRFMERVFETGAGARATVYTHQSNSELYEKMPRPGWWKSLGWNVTDDAIMELNLWGFSKELIRHIRKFRRMVSPLGV